MERLKEETNKIKVKNIGSILFAVLAIILLSQQSEVEDEKYFE